MSARLAWVDVFASGPMTGNPLAVLIGAEGWPASRMQAMAAELGLSETVFVLPARDERVAADLRIFTPARELPVAGHPVVGTAWVLHAAGRMPERALLGTGAGPLRVRVQGQVATMEQAGPEAGPEVDADEAASALGVPPARAPAARVWSTGVPQLMLAVRDVDALAEARPDPAALVRLGERDGWLGVSAYVLDRPGDGRLRAHVRHFAPRLGVPEDPVTGSAAGALGACLSAAGMAGGDGSLELVVSQGAQMGRPGEVAVRVLAREGAPARVQVGGRVVPLMEGRLLAR